MLVDFAEAQRLTSLSRSTLERLVRAKDFPEPVVITPSRRGFVRAEIEGWIRDRIARRHSRRPNDVAA
ncbi:MAG: helix-turn-helix transcriptional regulator [Geminicoccaceae bacterium]